MATLFAVCCALFAALTVAPSQDASQPSAAVLAEARASHRAHRSQAARRDVYAIVDYDISWQRERLWIVDAKTQTVRYSAHVRHAAASNDAKTGRAVTCSNVPGSLQSSTGAFVTEKSDYEGKYGRSLRIRGLEPGVNDKVATRDIVFHPAGRFTFSAGCFMVPDAEADKAIDYLVGGVFVFAHGCRGGESTAANDTP